jgi:CheY-like chemotaxis protein
MTPEQQNVPFNILLADDDSDDCFFFDKALKTIPIATHLTTVHDGEQLMIYLSENTEHLPDVLFLDINMPRKNGFECISEIKKDKKLSSLFVVMFSTFYSRDINYEKGMIKKLHGIEMDQFIRKPHDFEKLKQIIHKVLITATEKRLLNEEDEKLLT